MHHPYSPRSTQPPQHPAPCTRTRTRTLIYIFIYLEKPPISKMIKFAQGQPGSGSNCLPNGCIFDPRFCIQRPGVEDQCSMYVSICVCSSGGKGGWVGLSFACVRVRVCVACRIAATLTTMTSHVQQSNHQSKGTTVKFSLIVAVGISVRALSATKRTVGFV